MKSILQFITLITLLFATLPQQSRATVYTIEVSDFEFTQNFDSVLVGDTIQWVWVNGFHTTTSNGIPSGAEPWNELIDEFHTSFTYVIPVQGTYNYISVPDAPMMGESFVASYPVGTEDLFPIVSSFIVFTNSTHGFTYSFTIARQAHVEVSLYDVMGRKPELLFSEYLNPGTFQQHVASDYAGGLYLLELKVNDARVSKPVIFY